jgi:predicted dithiol-disulfide oxidoreductase (DUF899 family)/DNA-binding transcriptional ArsR family regulator
MTVAALRTVGPDEDDEDTLLDRVFFALSDPVRRAILLRLDQGALLVSELAAPFEISLQAVSRHIQVLVRAGLLHQERSGRISRCSLDAGPILTAALWLNRYSKYWQQQFDLLAAALSELDEQRTAHAAPHPTDKPNEQGDKMTIENHQVVSHDAWIEAREQLLLKEKAMTHARDALAAERRRMPWVAVKKAYRFDGPKGKASLLDLFEGRRQLIVYRAFFEPGVNGWPDHGCVGCSMVADQVAHLAHLNARDVTLAFASRAPQTDIAHLKARMGWAMPWYTITDSFDADFGVDEWHGHNAFIRDGERVFRTYFINGRGDEAMGTTWSYLDMTALGRQETWEDSPEGYPQSRPYSWWNWHDSYVPGATPDPK